MRQMSFIGTLLAGFLLVFAQSHVAGVPRILGVQVDLLPGLMACAALRFGIGTVSGLALAGGLSYDALSANPFGLSVLPLFAAGITAHVFRDLVLRDLLLTRVAVGFGAGLLVPLMSLGLLLTTGADVIVGAGVLWQLWVLGVVNGLMTPVWFWLSERLHRALDYGVVIDEGFRGDREIKRGRM